MLRILLIAILVQLTQPLHAQSTGVNLEFAFGQLKTNGAEPFGKALYEGSPDSAKLLASQLAPLIKSKGSYIGFEVLTRTLIGKRIERLIIVIYYEQGPVFMRLDVYDSVREKICLPAVVSKEASDILPLDIISASGK